MRLVRLIAVAAASLSLAALAHVPAGAQALDPSDMARGSAKAPVTIFEYASVGCPHCAKLHNEVFPAFKKKYIDTGKVRWVAREVITGDPRLAMAGFMLARCAPSGRYFDVTDAIYRDQEKLYEKPELFNDIAHSVGLTDEQIKACLTDPKNEAALNARTDLAKIDKVSSTPTLVIKGKIVSDGELTLAELDKIVAEAMAKPKPKAAAKPAAKPATPPAQKAPARK